MVYLDQDYVILVESRDTPSDALHTYGRQWGKVRGCVEYKGGGDKRGRQLVRIWREVIGLLKDLWFLFVLFFGELLRSTSIIRCYRASLHIFLKKSKFI